MSAPAPVKAYIIAARRTALGRIGGLHRSRRLETLSTPVVEAVLADCGLSADQVDEILLGNASAGGNPARLVALAAGLPETASATTIDRQCGSGLDAIIHALRLIGAGEADVIVAGGAESLSTAPWRIAKPKSLYQLPHFIGVEPSSLDASTTEPRLLEASEFLARELHISRAQQDAYAYQSHVRAQAAREARRFVGEIVPLRVAVEEMRDQGLGDPDLEAFEDAAPLLDEDGTLTPANTSAINDGAALVVAVSERVWADLGKPPALRLLASAAQGVGPSRDATAPIEAVRKLFGRLNGFNTKDIGLVELSETSAAQALAVTSSLGFDDTMLNPEGGAVVRGHPLGAAGAVLVVRLFTQMVRDTSVTSRPKYGMATLGTLGGMGLAALFEAV